VWVSHNHTKNTAVDHHDNLNMSYCDSCIICLSSKGADSYLMIVSKSAIKMTFIGHMWWELVVSRIMTNNAS
jgi:hypothetical protein